MTEKSAIGTPVHQVVKLGVAVLVVILIIHPNRHVQNFLAITILQPKSVPQELVQQYLTRQIAQWYGISFNKMPNHVNG